MSDTTGDDLRTSLRLFVRSWILCIFCSHICVFVAIKIKLKLTIHFCGNMMLRSVKMHLTGNTEILGV